MSGIYDLGRVKLLTAALNWPAANLVVSAWTGAPDFLVTDTKLSTIKARGHTEAGVSLPVTNPTVAANGTAATDAVVVPGIAVGQVINWLTMAELKSPHDDSELILFLDQTDAPLPFEGNGLDFVLQPDWLSNQGWFRP